MTKINLLSAFPGDDPTCKRIPLTQGQAALVSDEDYDRINQHKWQASLNRKMGSFYADRKISSGGKKIHQSMHREVLGLQPGEPEHVDHQNHRTTDNRRLNLQAGPPRKNLENRRDRSNYGTGVYRTSANRFMVQVHHDGERKYVGTYDTPEEAQTAREQFLVSLC